MSFDSLRKLELRFVFFLLFLVFVVFFVSSTFVYSQENVMINEILPNPSSGDEWIEFHNPDNVDLSSWIVEEKVADSESFNPYVIEIGVNLTDNPIFDVFVFSSNKLNNDGDTVRLKNGDKVIDEYTFGKTQKDISIGRSPDGTGSFVSLTSATKGEPNASPITATPTPTEEPEETPTPMAEPEQTATVTPEPPTNTPTPKPTKKPTPSPTPEGEILGEKKTEGETTFLLSDLGENEEDKEATEEGEEGKNPKGYLPQLMIGVGGILIIGATLTFVYPKIKKGFKKTTFNNSSTKLRE